MNRDQARALMEVVDVLRHFAEGGDVGYRMLQGRVNAYIAPTDKIILSNMQAGKPSPYVKVKPRYRIDPNTGHPVREFRRWTERIRESEVMP